VLEFLKSLFRGRAGGSSAGDPSLRAALAGQVHAARGLRQSEEHFERLVAGVRDCAIFLLDRQGNVLTWNAGAEQIKGYRAGEIIGRHLSNFYPRDAVSSGWPDHELRTAAATGRFEDEGWRVRKDGSTFWANVVITALRDETGGVRGFLKITRDLTDRKQAEEKLRLSEERFRLMVEGVKDYAIFMLDPEGRVVTWNAGAERTKGYRADEIIGRHFSQFYPREAVERGWPDEELKRAAAEGRFEDEGWRVRKDGSTFWANVVITALRDEAGTLRGFAKVTRDLTERRQAEENTRRLLREEAARQAAEEYTREIEQQRERLRVTLHSIGDGVIATDAKGRVTLLNPVAEDLTGWGSEDAAGQPLQSVFRIINESTGQEVENPVAGVLREGRVVGLAHPTLLISRDGKARPVDDSAAPIRDVQGELLGVVLVFRDGTEQRAKDRRRAARLAVTQSLAEAETIEQAAPRVLQALGDNLGWKVGGFWLVQPPGQAMRCLELWHTPSVRGDGFLEVSRRLRFSPGVGLPGRVWESGQPAWIPDVSVDTNFPRAAIAAEQGLRAALGFPLRAGRQVLGMIEFFHNEVRGPDADLMEMVATIGAMIGQFIERRSAEHRLRYEREWFRTTLASIGDAVIATDTDGKVAFVNGVAQTLTGWRQGEAIGQPVEAVFRILDEQTRRPIENPALLAFKEHVVLGPSNRTVLTSRDGVERPIDSSAAPIRDEDGQVGGAVLVFRDVTERRRLEDDLRKLAADLSDADRRKNEFLATLAHELRNPLAPIRNALHVLRLSPDRAPHDQALAMMQRQLEQLVRLVDDLMDVSRITRGKLELRSEPVPLATVVQSAVETSRPMIDHLGHELTVSLPDEPIIVDADLTRLAQVFSNLLNNSAKYMDPGGRIRLTAERRGEEVLVSVRDTGIGIAADQLSRIFEIFSQVEGSLERAQGGLGIGLTLVKRLVEMHGGRIEATSEGLGKGAEFLARLPVVAVAAGPLAAGGRDELGPVSSPLRIMIVDDNEDAANSLGMLLDLMGNDIRMGHDGLEAMNLAREYRPDVVLLDIGLPKLNGYEVARSIRQEPWGERTVLIAVTGWGQEADRRRSRESGFDHHMVKPVDPDELMRILAGLERRAR
jgi:PAS domain S-box-containing protein